ncbi:MAG: relaxase/mobilization nuclease domain-containing protein [Pleurocapsa sp. MO_226.B13]|nr:relaxase/mobilization nuclease domain-containing protein [Pleurocapsa sp. MO_226.B13]
MIGKQVKGKSFRGVLNYLHDHEHSRIIGGNMAGDTPRVMSAEFAVARRLNPQLEKAVYHSSLSLPKDEHLDDETWNAIAEEYLEGMEFIGSQYVVYRHSDKDHDHIHIVASRIRITDGTTVSDSWDYVRSEQLIRELEKKYELTPTISSTQKQQRGQTSGEKRLIERTGEASVREKLQQIIERETEQVIAMPELINRLKDRGVDARITVTRTGKIKGISYRLDGVATSGTHLGKAYTFGGLQKYKRVSYDDSFERILLIEASSRKPNKAAEIEPAKSRELNSQQTEQSQQYSELNQTKEQKEELARALVKQKKNQRQINQRLRTIRGRLAVLINNDTISVYAIEFNSERTQQEKFIVRQTETGSLVLKDELDYGQREKLLQAVKSVEQHSSTKKDKNANQNLIQLKDNDGIPKPKQEQSKGYGL